MTIGILTRHMNLTQIQGDNTGLWQRPGTAAPAPAATNSPELEVKDAQLIFAATWRELEGEFGRSRMRFPKELILLGGAPGAGKGTNSDFIRKVRGIEAQPIVVSQLLDTPEARAVKARGGMVGDREVVKNRCDNLGGKDSFALVHLGCLEGHDRICSRRGGHRGPFKTRHAGRQYSVVYC